MNTDIKILLCDDSAEFAKMARSHIESILSANERKYELFVFSEGTDMIDKFADGGADVVLLDIDMPVMTGFEAAERLQKINPEVNIVFITSHEDKVFQSYEFHPFWFVRKSHLEDLDIVFSRLLSKIDAQNEANRRFVNLICENQTVRADIREILYIQSYKHYIIIKNADGTENQLRCKISDAEEQLLPLHFVRIQNSIIVNCRFVTRVTSRSVVLCDEEEFSISRDRVEHVRSEYQSFMRST